MRAKCSIKAEEPGKLRRFIQRLVPKISSTIASRLVSISHDIYQVTNAVVSVAPSAVALRPDSDAVTTGFLLPNRHQ